VSPHSPPHKPFIVKSTAARDVTIAVIAGAALLAFVLWGILHMSLDVTGHSLLTGRIVAKHFEPRPEEQLSLGKGGLDEKNLDGVYTMDVRTPDGQTYKVFVEKPVFESHRTGDDLSFLPPPPKSP
jgi:hypothetical protein